MIVDMQGQSDPLSGRLLQGRVAASRKGWRTRRMMAAARARESVSVDDVSADDDE